MMTCYGCGLPAVVQWQRLRPGADGDTEPVAACADHALSPEPAARTHLAACSGPGTSGTCDCPPVEPEFPFDPQDSPEDLPQKQLPPGW